MNRNCTLFGTAAITATVLLTPSPTQSAQLIFRTGFEADVKSSGGTAIKDLSGADKSVDSPNDFGAHLENYPKIGSFNFEYCAGNDSQRKAQLADDPTGARNAKTGKTNRVLHYWQKEVIKGNYMSRIQSQVYNCKNFTEFTQRIRMYLHKDLLLLRDFGDLRNFTIEELWAPPNWTGASRPFRIALAIWKDKGSDFYFYFKAEDRSGGGWTGVKKGANRNVEVPFQEWFVAETYYKKGDASNGRLGFRIKRNGKQWQTVFDEKLATYDTRGAAQNLWGYNPMKMYMSAQSVTAHVRKKGGVAQMYWDDWWLWDGDARSEPLEGGAR